MLKLYHAHHSTCSQKVRLALAEKGLEYESIIVDLANKGHLTPEYLAINPNGVVPTLVHDDDSIMDSSVIVEYIDEVFPDHPLVPKDAVARAKVRTWMRFLEEVPTYAVRVPSFNKAFLSRFDGLSNEEFADQQAGPRPLRKHFYLKMSKDGFGSNAVQESIDQMKLTCGRMQRALENGPWLAGDEFSLADVVAAPLIDRIDDLGMGDIWTEEFPLVQDWFDRLKARSSYDVAMYKGARLSETHAIAALLKEEN
ncbi:MULTISPECIES: glutathione S-transferase family protein [Pacificibacter]|uniref:glutathione S-transferase family protein n=1 Tax=Pacificibacter TaxID=1042323 RepID=UPI001C08BCD1|nr:MULTISPECIES: glutathione S-transferase family protein [Pacificibacter]MBU2937742.1 glutathione S-transferase family protein [Pacificibacter marinus]MDO6616237.1 glutathione S-transferase family protein [Pacificibacter sp. 1_MG-2023]